MLLKQLGELISASALCLALGAANVQAAPIELKTVGEGNYRYLFWQLYNARLASTDGQFIDYQTSAPLLLELTYKRSISKQQFIDATVDEWKKLKHSSDAQQRQWATALENIWRDVQDGDRLSALLGKQQTVQFFLNDQPIGEITDRAFSEAFFDIWLHPDTSAPTLRRQLLATQ